VQEDSFAETTDPAEAELPAAQEPTGEDSFAESTASEAADDEFTLPQTGSALPLLFGFGVLALCLAAALRSAR
jgi:LPXTG-motif cell wall-anchored protein